MSLESLKKVLMAVKDEARGMRKSKLENRLNPKKPVVEVAKVDVMPADEKDKDMLNGMQSDESLDGGDGAPMDDMEAPETPEDEAAEPTDEEKAAAIEEIRKLLARS